MKVKEIGTLEAKTRLSELLDEVEIWEIAIKVGLGKLSPAFT